MITRWALSPVDSEDGDPLFDGLVTSDDGNWCRWEDADLKLRACSESRRAVIESLEDRKRELAEARAAMAASERREGGRQQVSIRDQATIPLRTRAEVDAEIADWIRASVVCKRHINPTWARIMQLCSEPVADCNTDTTVTVE